MSIRYDDKFVKTPGIESEYTPEMISDLVRCSEDVLYFLNFVTIVTLDGGRKKLGDLLYPFQKDIIEMCSDHRYLVLLCARQCGKSTIVGAFALWYAIFKPDKFIGVASNKASSSKDILRRVKIMYEELPFYLKPGVVEYNKQSIEFENGSKIETAGTTEDTFRGRSINCVSGQTKVILKNRENIEEISIDKYFRRKYYDRKFEILTHEGFKPFDGFKKMKRVESFLVLKFSNGNSLSCTHDHKLMSQDKTFKTAKDFKIGDVLFERIEIIDIKEIVKEIYVFDALNVKDTHAYWTNGVISHNCLVLDEFGFISDGIARQFYASVYPAIAASTESKIIIISTPNGVFNLFHEIYSMAEKNMNDFKYLKVPWNLVPGRDENWKKIQLKNLGQTRFNQEFDLHFLGSSNTVISPEAIEYINTTLEDDFYSDLNERLRVFEKPIDGCNYIMGIDPSKGTGEHDGCIQIYRIESFKPVKLINAATFQSNTTDAFEFSSIINKLSIYYNEALIMCENNGEGAVISQNLWWTFENPNLYNSGNKENEIGIRATKSTKPKAIITMKKLIEDGSLIIKDRETAKQLSCFIEKKNGGFECTNGGDDLVSALYWMCFGITTENFEDVVDLFKNKGTEDEEDVWGILADIDNDHYIENSDWSWMNT